MTKTTPSFLDRTRAQHREGMRAVSWDRRQHVLLETGMTLCGRVPRRPTGHNDAVGYSREFHRESRAACGRCLRAAPEPTATALPASL